MILTDAAITNALNQTVQKIREGDLEQAQAGLTVLAFHRLIRDIVGLVDDSSLESAADFNLAHIRIGAARGVCEVEVWLRCC